MTGRGRAAQVAREAGCRILTSPLVTTRHQDHALIRAAQAADRRVCLAGRSMHRMTAAAKSVGLLKGVPDFIKVRHIENCLRADPAYGKGVADALGIAPGNAG